MHIDTAPALVCIVISSVLLYYLLIKRRPLEDLRGPEGGYLLGVEYNLRKEAHVGETSLRWEKEYGPTYKIPGCFGETILVTSDPRAISHILHEHAVDYPATRDIRKLYELIFGRGVLWVVGDEHKRHRRLLSPAFSLSHMKSFIPLFQEYAKKLSDKWNTEIQQGTQIIDVVTWSQKVTLDIIGETLEDKPNELTEALHELEKLGFSPSIFETLLQAIPRHLPASIGRIQAKYLPLNIDKLSMKYLEVSSRKARELIHKPGIAAPHDIDQIDRVVGKHRDVLSVLVEANQAEDPRKRLADHEVASQISTLLQAGHHTTGYSLAWILYELSQHPADQQRVYEEIKQLRNKSEGNFTAKDYDNLANGWLGICTKESLRLHPILPQLPRAPRHTDVIPLQFPVESAAGTTLSQVEVHAGQRIVVDVTTYNRLESVWGADATKWNPARFLEPSTRSSVTVGMTSNLLTFSGGPKGCIGWRFALMELHTLLASLLEQFRFDVPEGVEIKDKLTVLIIPTVVGSEVVEAKLPLLVQSRKKQ
ncbi:cytochrome p450 [Moniliophthora roreri]|nr:cytochrome p450 [Moniliophthora roreri]